MDLNWLEDFLALAEQHSFSRAADCRNVTQPAFSRRIRALEEWIGVPLFIRSAQGVSLTAAGAFLQTHAETITRELYRVRRESQAMAERATATLYFAATHALSFTFFPGWIRRHIDFEGLGTLNLMSDSMEACEQIMLDGKAHFLLCYHHPMAPTRFAPERFPSVTVGGDVLVPLSAPGRDGRPVWPAAGGAQAPTRRLAYSNSSGLGRILSAIQTGSVVGSETVFTSHLAATLLTMARQGHGLAWLPQTLADDDLAAGRLVAAGAADLNIPVEIRIFRDTSCRGSAADAIWQRLTQQTAT
ncbi:LysR family transcriptional regulator [Bradyrhizobium prioriisuperbiae]|uniref:LysR family transcriptional regulator n=1 Tax=Bradyrhizobium prioriisuperbiae TaxID=2854389 RepID=UPI0028E8E2F7|nr:LysR family transcriptional regulator [Bradyrhizobium prioritasuperba]